MSAIVYREPYKLPAGILAVAVHGAFFALLYLGFAWQTQPSGTMSVELWQSLPGEVAEPSAQPRIEEVAPPPQPEKVVEPEKIVKPEIVLPDKKKVEPDIKKTETKPAKPDKKKPAQSSAEGVESKSAGQGTGSSIADQAARERGERVAAIGRMVDEHIDKIKNKIRRNIVMPPDVAEDARAEFSVTLLPGGSVLGARLVRSSGNAAYDNAVERAILKSQPLPLPADAALFNKFRELKLVFMPVE
ncbi:MAG: cell envelope integrity protein TolA [Nitrosomonadales bacterium]|nr:cell envelope integrity protein TolA [Nitrosomonadales bacterium]